MGQEGAQADSAPPEGTAHSLLLSLMTSAFSGSSRGPRENRTRGADFGDRSTAVPGAGTQNQPLKRKLCSPGHSCGLCAQRLTCHISLGVRVVPGSASICSAEPCLFAKQEQPPHSLENQTSKRPPSGPRASLHSAGAASVTLWDSPGDVQPAGARRAASLYPDDQRATSKQRSSPKRSKAQCLPQVNVGKT